VKVVFTVPGEPQGKGRPRFSKRGSFVKVTTPYETVVYENLIRVEYQRQVGIRRFEDSDMLDLRILAYYAIPESASKKKKKAMEAAEVRPTKKPDADNVLKIVADSLNQLAYRDDAQVVDTQIHKFYSHQPRLEISIQNIETSKEDDDEQDQH